jgi:hypothetical protein
MSDPIKLKAAGEKHTLDVTACRQLPFGERPEIEFVGRDGSKVWVPKSSSDRQLARLELTMDSVVGHRLTIKRDPNGNKVPFWGFYLEENGNGTGGGAHPRPAATTQPAAPPAPAAAVEQTDKGSALYVKITAWVLKEIVPLYQKAGVPVTQEATAACVHTLYINASKNGH